ncbi:MAG: wax ester/triacylglycerol synthase family O-acyltransferase [Mycobacterium sp.]
MPRDEHRLSFMDQTGLELMRATGRDQLIQCVWVYEHPIDMHGLERFHRNVAASYGNRLVERSPLPFGRPRWVRGDRSQVPIRVEARPRPRDELIDWADELASLPIDPEHGPCWRLVVQPLTDGSTAVSMFGSHVIADGVGAIRLVKDATEGRRRNPGYLSHGARPALRGIASDLHQAVRDVPETIRVLARASAFVYRSRREIARAVASKPVADVAPQPTVVVPAIAIFIDGDEWDRRAKHLGGNSYSLLAAFAAKLGERMGRQRATDGAVTLIIAINVRESDEDTRAIALTLAKASVEPANVTADLSDLRARVREARENAMRQPDPALELLALMPWLPDAGVKAVAELLFGYSEDLPVSCSNLGDLPPELSRIDGTQAEYVFIRAVDANVTQRDLERSRGQLVIVSGRINGKVSISVEAYEVGAPNSKARLRDLAHATLAEFQLTGAIE